MKNVKSMRAIISVVLIFSILFLPIVEATQKVSLFNRAKNKIHEKKIQFQDKNWWKQKSIASSIGFVAGKLGGVAGAALGYIAGAAIGGPLAAGAGAVLGFRIGNSLTKVFGKAIGVIVARVKIKEKKKITVQTFKDAIKSINVKKVSAEGIGAVFGDLIGGTFGAAMGIALLAGTGAWAIPILGTVTAAYLGGKLGKAMGRGIGKWIGKKIMKKSYTVAASAFVDDNTSIDDPKKDTQVTSTNIQQKVNKTNTNSLASKKLEYETAYKEYVSLSTKQSASSSDIQHAIVRYRQAYDAYIAEVKGVQAR